MPCSSCVRRNHSSLCAKASSKEVVGHDSYLRDRVTYLESLLNESGVPMPPKDDNNTDVDDRRSESPHRQRAADKELLCQDTVPSLNASQAASSSRSIPSPPADSGTVEDVTINTEAVSDFAPTLGSGLTAEGLDFIPPINRVSSLMPPPSAPPARHGMSSTLSQGTAMHTQDMAESDDQSLVNGPGSGVLMIGRAGRSKWLGPTAATEWVRDVRSHSNTLKHLAID